jgi:hypothetical protein
MLNDPHYLEVKRKNRLELDKPISRSQIINFLLSLNKCNTNYLEIGVRNPDDNFNKIKATNKYSVDNGVEFKDNPVDFKMTSDDFFTKLFTGEILSNDIKFDVIFIDGLHLSEQVDRDIINSLLYIKENGFIVIHDCNPISEWNARENFKYMYTPAQDGWLGTTWKAFFKWRQNPSVKSCCIDSDHGVGIITKKYAIGDFTKSINPFFEFHVLDRNRNKHLNLINFEDFKMLFQNT